ncbi:MAG: M48 family metallopeptidase [Burkholderiales bacterium]
MHRLRQFLFALGFALLASGAPAQPAGPPGGVDVGKPSALRHLVPAERLEQAAAQQYTALLRQAAAKGALARDDHPQLVRLRAIGKRVTANAARFNPAAAQWRWEVNLIGSNQVNAFCMPGGKIAFFTGIIDRLRLTDDEIAAVMGHEVAHALREHARERVAKSELTRLGVVIAALIAGDPRYADAFNLGGALLTLKFSRDDETEADAIGLELAARAGFDPRAGVTLWKKMGAASKGSPPQWLSTHPTGRNRIREIERRLPEVLPLYEQRAQGPIPR